MTTNLLIVDDHKIVTDGLSAMIAENPQFAIKGIAHDGATALEMVKVLSVDIVMLDIDMPVLNGIETAKILKKEYPDIKVIILTMHDERAMIRLFSELGANGYLLKNASKEELVTALEKVKDGELFYSEEVSSILLRPDEEAKKSPVLNSLTDREIEIIQLIASGLSNKEIGDKLFISHRTVDTHRTNLMQKLDLHNIAGLVRFAIQHGLLSEE